MQGIVVLYYLVALVAALILLNAYKRNTTIGSKIGKVMLATFLLVVFYSFNIVGTTFEVKSVALSLSFITMDIMMILFYEYILEFIGWKQKVPGIFSYCIYAYALVDTVFMLLNPYNNISLEFRRIPFGDDFVLGYVPKLPFIIHNIYIVAIVLFVVVLLVLKCGETPRVYWKRYYMLIVGVGAAVGVNVLNLNMTGIIPVDISSALYCVVGILMYYNTFHYLPAVTLNITRRMILNYLSEPVVLFDYEGRLADYSADILKLMPGVRFEVAVMTLEDFIREGEFKGFRNTEKDQEFEWTGKIAGENHIFQCKFKCMKDSRNRGIGKIFVFHDITAMRKAYFELEQSTLYDPLTGFYNKQSYMTQVPQWSDSRYWPVALGVCNVNGMRSLNDRYGSAYGDFVMKQLARCVRIHIGEDAFAAKVDNGDILVVMEGKTHEDAAAIFEAVKRDVEKFFEKDNPVQVEYGIAVKEREDVTMERVLSDARTSMQNKKMLRDNSASSSLVDSLKQTLSESDYETEEHVERTREMAARLGKAMNLSDSDIGKLELLAVLHDIGKVAIPHHVLVKKGKLNDEEFKIMQQHTIKGYRIAKSSPELGDIAECILSHHEKWDGTGYPNGLKGEEIPLLARIISAVDSHDVMVHNRPYHQAMPEEDAIKELRRCAGTQFDPHIVEVFTRLLEEEELPKVWAERERQKQEAEEAAREVAAKVLEKESEKKR
ncbi:MAG: HD domain-containing protein [Lachnospiraceae bacterium]|nr:HD domain-containing protein [Lachnospiraceae bacterium]